MNKMYLLLLAIPFAAHARPVTDIAELGPHIQIMTVTKNVNPENIAIVYTKVDGQCRFVNDPSNRDEPVFDFYWRMGGTTYKPMNGLLKSEFHKRMSFVGGSSDRATHFQLEANDLKEVKTDIADPRLDVRVVSGAAARAANRAAALRAPGAGACDVQAFITLGPSDGNARIRLDSIYGEGRAFPPRVDAVTLKGEVVDANGVGTGKQVSRRYSAQ